MDIYYAEIDNLVLPEPEPAVSLIAKRFSDTSGMGGLFKCPSFVSEMKHTFIVPSPFTVTINWDGNYFSTPNHSQQFFDKHINIRSAKDGLVSINFLWYVFLADTDTLEMQQLPAYMLDSDLERKTSFISGTLNVAKHFRTLDMARIFNEPGQVTINRDDPLYAVRFATKEPIQLKRFRATQDFKSILDGVSNTLDRDGRTRPVEYWHSIIKKYRIKEKLLKLAKENLY